LKIENDMRHYNEEEIGLFALGNAIDKAERDAFDLHIKECAGCRELYNEMIQFYDMAVEASPLLKQAETEEEVKSLAVNTHLSRKHTGNLTKYSYFIPAKFIRFIFDRPVISTVSAFAMVALFAIVINMKTIFKDNNPTYFYTNDTLKVVQVFNKDKELLWKMGWEGDFSYNPPEYPRAFSLLCDLDGDGKNEFITSIKNNESDKKCLIRIFDYKGNLLHSKEVGEDYTFKGKPYFTNYKPRTIFIDDIKGNGKKEIFFSICHLHSPSVLFRFDANLNILGEYWHYGHVPMACFVDIENNRKKYIILAGMEDNEMSAVFSVLDPEKIIGKTEASRTPGFGLESSKAEVFYTKFPETDIAKVIILRTKIDKIISNIGDNLMVEWLGVFQGRGYKGKDQVTINYYFSRVMKPFDLKFSGDYEQVHNELIKDGKLNTKMDEAYRERLMEGIRYWDGKEWQKEWCRVKTELNNR
jgi:hypothetical protein